MFGNQHFLKLLLFMFTISKARKKKTNTDHGDSSLSFFYEKKSKHVKLVPFLNSFQNKINANFFGYQTKYEYFAGFSCLNSTLRSMQIFNKKSHSTRAVENCKL